MLELQSSYLMNAMSCIWWYNILLGPDVNLELFQNHDQRYTEAVISKRFKSYLLPAEQDQPQGTVQARQLCQSGSERPR